jgi:hypothetical protein
MSKNKQEPVTLTVGKDGKLEITGHTDVSLSGSTKTELLIDPRPISLKVNTETDVWAVSATFLVGLGGIALAGVVGWFTYQSGKQAAAATLNSAKQAAAAKAAELRNDWMNRLRIEAADFFAAAVDISIVFHMAKISMREGFGKLPEDHPLFTKFHKHKAVIWMMFDGGNPKFVKVLAQLQVVADAVGSEKSEAYEVTSAATSFLAEMGAVLELAWQDIKDDLYGAAKNKQAAAV